MKNQKSKKVRHPIKLTDKTIDLAEEALREAGIETTVENVHAYIEKCLRKYFGLPGMTRPERPRIRFTDYSRLPGEFPVGGEGLNIILHHNSNGFLDCGFGFDDKNNIIGWDYKERYSLTIKESIEWRLGMLWAYWCGDSDTDESPSGKLEAKWLEMVWNAMPESPRTGTEPKTEAGSEGN